MTRVRLALVAVVFVSAAIAAGTLLPWSGTADAYDHLDYVVQVHNGSLPDAVGHEWKPDGHLGSNRSEESRQFASAHPPLYYALGAAVAGGLLESSDWQRGVLAMRGVTALFGLVGLAGLAWIGWGIGGRDRHRWAVGLPLIGGLFFPYLRFSTEPYNDVPLAAVSLLAIALCIHQLRFGPRLWSIISLTGLAAAGMGLKSTFVLTLAGICLTLGVVTFLHVRGRIPQRLGVATAVSGLPFAASALAWGWFYLLNAERSGFWYRSSPKDPVGNRSDKSLTDNLTNPDFYLVVPRGLIGRGSSDIATFNASLSLVLFVLLVMATVTALVISRTRYGRLRSRWIVLIGFALLAHLAGSYALQLSHATGFGAFNARYFLPSVATIAALVVAGVLWGRFWTISVSLVAAVLLGANIFAMLAYSAARAGRELTAHSVVTEIAAQASTNGLPPSLPAAAIALAALALAALALTSPVQDAMIRARERSLR